MNAEATLARWLAVEDALRSRLAAGRAYTTLELKVNIVRALTEGVPRVRAEGQDTWGAPGGHRGGPAGRSGRQAVRARHHHVPDLRSAVTGSSGLALTFSALEPALSSSGRRPSTVRLVDAALTAVPRSSMIDQLICKQDGVAMGQETSFRDIQVRSNEIGIRKIGLNDLWQSLREGFDDFDARPTLGVFLTILYPLFALLLTLFLIGENRLHLAFPMVAGFTLIGPVVSVGLVEMSRRRERGLDLSWRSTFDFVHSASFAPVLALSIVLVLLYVAWLFMAEFLYFGLFGQDPPISASDFVTQLVTTRRGGALIFYGIPLGFVFAVTALAISVVAFPLVLDRPASAATAVAVSLRAVASNPMVMAVWGVIVAALLAAGTIVFLVGLAAVVPILGHATWHLYRKVVESP